MHTILSDNPKKPIPLETPQTVTFVSGSRYKYEEVQRYLSEFEPTLVVEQATLDLPEYQSLDIRTIALAKAEEAWRLLQKPVLIDDSGLYLERYHNFPGPLTKYVLQGIGLEGFWLLAKEDPRATYLSCLAYYYAPHTYKLFEGTCSGTLIEPIENTETKQMPFGDTTTLFIPEGSSKSISQLLGTEFERTINPRRKAVASFAHWLRNRDEQ